MSEVTWASTTSGTALRRTHGKKVAIALLTATAAVALAGCGGSSGSADATGAVTSTPTTSASTTVAPVTGAGAAVPSAAGAPTPTTIIADNHYPSDANAYAQAAVNAWRSGDHTRLGQLTTGDGAHVFQALSAGDYDQHFTRHDCQGAAGSTYCTFYNNVGDMLRLRISNPRLGQAHAIVGGQFEPVTFPDDPQAYAQEALDAWRAGNGARLALLTTTDAYHHINAVSASQKQADWTFDHSEGAAGSTYLSWRNPAGDHLAFRFINAGINPSAGPRHRVVDVVFLPHS